MSEQFKGIAQQAAESDEWYLVEVYPGEWMMRVDLGKASDFSPEGFRYPNAGPFWVAARDWVQDELEMNLVFDFDEPSQVFLERFPTEEEEEGCGYIYGKEDDDEQA